MKLVDLLAVVASAWALAPRCADRCRSRLTSQLPLPRDPQCSCFPSKAKVDDTPLLAKTAAILKLDANGIYYEPAELYPAPISYLDPPFYVINPIANVRPKYKERLIDTVNMTPKEAGFNLGRELKTMKRKSKGDATPENLNTKKPYSYLDVNLGEQKAEARSSDITEELHQIERSLSECLDLHVLTLSRKHNTVNELLNTWGPVKFSKLNNLSDDYLRKAIDNTCSGPTKYVEKSLGEIIINWTKLQPISNITKHIDKDNLYVLNDNNAFIPQNHTYIFPNNYSDPRTMVNNKEERKLTSTEARNEVNNNSEPIRLDYNMFTRNVSLDMEKIENNVFEVTSSARSIKANDTTHKSNFFPPTMPMSVDTISTTPVNSVKLTNFNPTSLDVLLINKNANTALQDVKKMMYKDNVNAPKEPLNYRGFDKEEKGTISSQLMDINEDTYRRLSQDRSEDNRNGSSENFDDESVTIVYAKSRQTYNESEIPPQRVITREFANDTLLSVINGTEDLLHHVDEDNVSRNSNSNVEVENVLNGAGTDATDASLMEPWKRVAEGEETDDVPKIITSPVISGSFYFLFGQEHIPAKFIQKPDGKIHVGIDGPTLCDKSSHGLEKQTLLLAALCNCAQYNNCSTNEDN